MVGTANTFFLTYRVCPLLGSPDIAKSVSCHRVLNYFCIFLYLTKSAPGEAENGR
jgi:hypothetical protein